MGDAEPPTEDHATRRPRPGSWSVRSAGTTLNSDPPDRHRHAAARPGDGGATPREPRRTRPCGGRSRPRPSHGALRRASDLGAGPCHRTKASPRPVGETVARCCSLLGSKGLKVFAVIDQQAEARAGRPRPARDHARASSATPPRAHGSWRPSPLAALDLPLKVLVWADGDGTQVSYTAPAALAARYGVTAGAGGRVRGHPRADRRPCGPLTCHGLCTRCSERHPTTGYTQEGCDSLSDTASPAASPNGRGDPLRISI